MALKLTLDKCGKEVKFICFVHNTKRTLCQQDIATNNYFVSKAVQGMHIVLYLEIRRRFNHTSLWIFVYASLRCAKLSKKRIPSNQL